MKRIALILLYAAALAAAAAPAWATITPLELRQGSTGPALNIWIKDYDTDNKLKSCDLTGTTITCTMRNLRTGANVFTNRAAVVYDATKGKIRCVWQSGDTAAIGEYAIQIRILDVEGKLIILPGGEDAQVRVKQAY